MAQWLKQPEFSKGGRRELTPKLSEPPHMPHIPTNDKNKLKKEKKANHAFRKQLHSWVLH